MTTMRAVQVTSHGQPGEVLAVRTVDRPEPEAGEVRVQVSAASLNFNDIDRCLGKLVSVPTPPPFTLGMDVCGVVDAVGDGAEEWLGRRVVAITKTALGGIAEYAIAPTRLGVRRAPELDDAEATAFLLTFQTSHLALFRAGSTAGRRDPGGALGGQRAGHGRHPAGQGQGRPGHRRGRRPREGCAVCRPSAPTWSSTTSTEDFVEAVLAGHRRRGCRCGLRPDRAGLRGAVVALHGAWWPVPGRGFADDDDNGMTGRPLRMACIGNIDIVAVMVAWADSVDPGMRRFGFNPFGRDVADEIHADLLRLVADGSIRPHIGRRVAMEEAGAALDEHEAAGHWVAPWSRWPGEHDGGRTGEPRPPRRPRASTPGATPSCAAPRSRPSTRRAGPPSGWAGRCRP